MRKNQVIERGTKGLDKLYRIDKNADKHREKFFFQKISRKNLLRTLTRPKCTRVQTTMKNVSNIEWIKKLNSRWKTK